MKNWNLYKLSFGAGSQLECWNIFPKFKTNDLGNWHKELKQEPAKKLKPNNIGLNQCSETLCFYDPKRN
jgi:hypothetical protein